MTETAKPVRIPYMITTDRVSFVLNTRMRSYARTSEIARQLIPLLQIDDALDHDVEAIGELADVQTWIATRSQGRVTVDDCDRLRLDGALIDYGLTGRISKIIEQGVSFSALANFIERVSRNPDPSVAEDLYRFLEKGNLPLDPDGFVLAFKKVDPNYWSFHSGAAGKVRYLPDTVAEMPREDCDPNRQRTCSRGLHACSFEYLNYWYRTYGAGHLMIVRIDPEHVTAIPMDHNDQKLRCCKMEVVGEIPEEDAKDYFQKAVDERHKPVPQEPVYPTYDNSNGGELAGGPETNEDGSRNGWVGNEWLPVSPVDEIVEQVEDATAEIVRDGMHSRLKFHAVDDGPQVSDELAEPVSAAEWSKRGYEAGDQAGGSDAVNDYAYVPEFEMPPEIEGDSVSRSVYSKAFVEGYDHGFNAASPLQD